MSYFWSGFEKQAEENKSVVQKFKDTASKIPKGVLGTAAALGGYAIMRKPLSKRTLSTTIRAPKSKQNSFIRKTTDRILYGTDKPLYTHGGQSVPNNAKKIKGTVLHTEDDSSSFFKGKKNIGDVSKSKHLKKLEANKAYEAKFIKSISKDKAIKTNSLSNQHKGVKGLSGIHNKFSKGNKDYYIKPTAGYGAGVGGKTFVHSSDVAKFLSGKKLNKNKTTKIKSLLKNPKGNIIQEDIKIKKSPLTNASSEFRIHAVNGKVVKGAGGVRGKNVEDSIYTRGAEKHFQEFLDKVPKNKRKGVFWAPDIAKTKDGYKIIELNAGTAASGLIDPRFLKEKNKGIGGIIASMESARKNSKIYKQITGRRTSHDAATKALTLGAAAEASRRAIGKKENKPS